MSLDSLLSSLNSRQREAATMADQHALVLAGAGSGKTKTIVARAAYLIAQGVPAHRIQILTFTRRAASEIVTRVKDHLGEQASQLHASTFHTWCMGLIRRAPKAFGAKDFSVIDREDQVQLYRALRGASKGKANDLPTAAQLCDIYSFARNTGMSLSKALMRDHENFLGVKSQIARIMKAYEQKKLDRHYLDYDDILDLVAQRLSESPKVCEWVGRQYDHLLVDEMQDTNPLQWSLLSPLKESCCLFCVGDDAQSIYGFRGADFRNVHSFQERVPGSVVLKLTKNYRSTQEILGVSNWLLADSPLQYGKKLVAARGAGERPQLHSFSNEWEEGQWVTKDIQRRRGEGDNWRDHMVLARSSYSARAVESSLLAADIPYRFIGGTKLLESAHVRDMLSLLRIVGNPLDEIAIMRYLTLFPGVGETTASRILEQLMQADSLESAIVALQADKKVPPAAAVALSKVNRHRDNVSKSITIAVRMLEKVLEAKYRNQDWPKRQQDFKLVAKLAEKHTSILAFIEEYLLDPIHISMVGRNENDDVVTVITIHSGKGTESKTCYVINAGPGSFPSNKAVGDSDQVEEERRVLYVALTRAMDNLIVTRQSYSAWAVADKQKNDAVESYFFNDIPKGLFDEFTHNRAPKSVTAPDFKNQKYSVRGINLD
jgi:DNA helicase-2/ATP-dependent DNA helicase PcrA